MISAQFLGHRSRGVSAFLFFASELKNLHHLSFSISVVGVVLKGASQHDTHRDFIYASTVYVYIYIDEWRDESLSFGIKKAKICWSTLPNTLPKIFPNLMTSDGKRSLRWEVNSQILFSPQKSVCLKGVFCFFMTDFVRPNNSSHIKHLVVFYVKAYA